MSVLISTYFHGCANIIHKKLHLSKNGVSSSTVINIFLIIGFLVCRARLQEAAELSDTLPKQLNI
jgi:hypothetical protein